MKLLENANVLYLSLKVPVFLKEKSFIFAQGPSVWTKKSTSLAEVFFLHSGKAAQFFFSDVFNTSDVHLVGTKQGLFIFRDKKAN